MLRNASNMWVFTPCFEYTPKYQSTNNCVQRTQLVEKAVFSLLASAFMWPNIRQEEQPLLLSEDG